MTLNDLISEAYAEDIPRGDLTTDNLGLKARIGKAKLIAKEDLVLSGREIFDACLKSQEPTIEMKWQFENSALILKGQTVCLLKGELLKILRAERVALNFLGRLSGIATLTRCFVHETAGTNCKILDTRKTTPLLRRWEKQAVRDGGGTNHRMTLSDAVLIKDNHIRAVGSLKGAVEAIRDQAAGAIEVECRTMDEVKMAVELRVQRILLDNMSTAEMAEARALIPRVIEVEASGNMTLGRIREVAQTGVDFISVGALTHSAPCADFSLMFDWATSEPV